MPSNTLLGSAVAHPRLWMTLAWHDVVQSYRRTVFGPFWITVNMVIFTVAMTFVYAAIFGVQPREYSSFVVCGMIIWWWIVGILNESSAAFLGYSQFIRGMPCDKSVFIWATAFKQVIIFAHNAVVYVVLILIGFVKPSIYMLLAIPALVMLFLISVPLIGMLSILHVRYRDLQRLIGSGIIILMMVTPVFWKSEMLTGWRSAIVLANPLYYFIEFVRKPLLGEPVSLNIVAAVAATTVVAWIAGVLFFRRYSRFVVFWL
jgi:ABC-2 type transport system permease protein